ncbi:MAG: twin-arginine translocase TatA/TatE family subunit [Blastomonas fulva]|jgi:sec-independent protein translocase protein TatA|uniref:Sec-independent protein translocase protein TatA n=1 Tax=Blastomonas fulva TaxID=1550728 RepID=A0ABN5B036_9SPHN|nr:MULTISPECIES: twin-arginine translocase TatA/TatE family subunit [Blastomonas]AOF99886.1 twin arginine-targeting translocase, TatA/E family protein [Blastomonas sp. RAC04]ASR50408.1 Sec-independent protein translocase TatA [Blastomonas fulva]KPF76075.1 preprotein translocase subunit SecA [Blastomonas sp. AAP25]MCO5792375.1 twin-arginine translocase TatA/TatE family subunit [Blastomonas sp.]MDK2757659.1 twin-arginine translocase TatA/TatE family subunit [Blastomonas fulva]
MGSFSLMHWVIVLIIIVLLFGGGRISSIMGDVAKGIKSFKKGMAEDEEPVQPKRPVAQIEAPPARTIDGTATTTPSEERKPG